MPRYDFAMLVTLEADSYEDAKRDVKHLAGALGNAAEESISAVLDYEYDNEGQRVLYLDAVPEEYDNEDLDREISMAQGSVYDEQSQAWLDRLLAEKARRA